MIPGKRKLVSRLNGIASRQRVYRINEGLEVDEISHYEVHRSRVLFDDVILVTHHRYRGVAFLILTALLCILLAAIAYAIGQKEATVGWVFFGISSGPLLVAFALRLAIGMDEVNVYSRRSQARLRFFLRKGRARRLKDEIVADVRRSQNAMRPPPPQEPQVSTESLPAM